MEFLLRRKGRGGRSPTTKTTARSTAAAERMPDPPCLRGMVVATRAYGATP